MLASIDAYMTAYGQREEAVIRARARQRREPDEEGFVTVTRGGRNGAARQEEARERLEREKERKKEFGDFYRWQGREKRKEKEKEVRRKFEEDLAKVKRMREARGRIRVSLVDVSLVMAVD